MYKAISIFKWVYKTKFKYKKCWVRVYLFKIAPKVCKIELQKIIYFNYPDKYYNQK